MARRTFAFAAALSLMLSLTAAVLWARSYFVGEVWYFPHSGRTSITTAPWGHTDSWCYQRSVASGRGRLEYARREIQQDKPIPAGRYDRPPDQALSDLNGGATRSDRWFNTLGFGYFNREKHYVVRPPVQETLWGFLVLTVPYWAIVAVTAAPAALWAVGWARRRRSRLRRLNRQCPRCGYDLRASATRCPECGEAIESVAA